MMSGYIGTVLDDDIIIDKLFTLHYFEYAKGFAFVGEKHDFWELVYIDKGEVIVTADKTDIKLCHGDIIFHKPNEWHNIRSENASNSVIITFSSASPSMSFFENRIMKVGNIQKKLLSKIIAEGINTFYGPLGDPYTKQLIKRDGRPKGSEQLIRQYISELLILLMRNDDTSQMSSFKSHITDTSFDEITAYMMKNLDKELSLREIANYANISISSLREIFRRNAGCGVNSYFIELKIEKAKNYIREDNYNITQIAELLGYSGLHYFSRQFKSRTGMSPLEYSKSVKALVNENI